jgi:hypothetical protein
MGKNQDQGSGMNFPEPQHCWCLFKCRTINIVLRTRDDVPGLAHSQDQQLCAASLTFQSFRPQTGWRHRNQCQWISLPAYYFLKLLVLYIILQRFSSFRGLFLHSWIRIDVGTPVTSFIKIQSDSETLMQRTSRFS